MRTQKLGFQFRLKPCEEYTHRRTHQSERRLTVLDTTVSESGRGFALNSVELLVLNSFYFYSIQRKSRPTLRIILSAGDLFVFGRFILWKWLTKARERGGAKGNLSLKLLWVWVCLIHLKQFVKTQFFTIILLYMNQIFSLTFSHWLISRINWHKWNLLGQTDWLATGDSLLYTTEK